MSYAHSFHIPVMGIGFTVDTPAKVAHYGISSAISLVDDILVEKMREFYCRKFDIPFQAISDKIDDFRAKRITAYLNLIDEIVKKKFEELKKSIHQKGGELEKYMEMLPDLSEIKLRFNHFIQNNNLKGLQQWLHQHLPLGSIDVNIMTKLDRETYKNNKKLPREYNDAHAALRGFAKSDLNSSVVLSAGMNPRLYSYMENFDDFYPNEKGEIKKRIILKVSDYRSALIQGKFLAKKGIWISEYRIESGLNCGGHAFATDGYLMGPILEEFKVNREALIDTTHKILVAALEAKGKTVPKQPMPILITAQGGVGTSDEHEFILDYYDVDSVGWGTPFLLAQEVTNVDDQTLELLSNAREKDLYLSGISPLGVPFNNIRGNTKDIEKQEFIDKNRPGSPCPKKYVEINKDFGEKAICIASRQYQFLKLKELRELHADNDEKYREEFDKVVEKACICVGLGTSALHKNKLDYRKEGPGVSVCPGPNMAYYSRKVSLKEMVSHIYGKSNIIERKDRPHVFIKELSLYVDYLKNKVGEMARPLTEKNEKYIETFHKNLSEGIEYYKELFNKKAEEFQGRKVQLIQSLDHFKEELNEIRLKVIGVLQ
ncbi:MAG: hypothetical protein MI975_01335 [Cytophagales bacterium]|nr:hypothetical protein [Cytophagales bacterium]